MNILEDLLLSLFALKKEELKPFAALKPFKNLECFLLKLFQDKYCRKYRKDSNVNSLPQPKELEPNDRKNNNRNLNGTDSGNLNQYFYCGFSTDCDTLSFQVQIERTQTLFTVTKLNTVHINVFIYQPKFLIWITSFDASRSRLKESKEYLIDKDSWSLYIEEFSLENDENYDKLLPEVHTVPCLHSDGSVNQQRDIQLLFSAFLKKFL